MSEHALHVAIQEPPEDVGSGVLMWSVYVGDHRCGIVVSHPPNGCGHEGQPSPPMMFAGDPVAIEVMRSHERDEPLYALVSLEPLTLGDCLNCKCSGMRGTVEEGRWVDKPREPAAPMRA